MMDASQPTLLIVDDDRLNRAALAELLKDECRILLAKDGPSALKLLEQGDVSLVLLDVSMPGMDGYEVLRTIRGTPASADLGVIFITGLAEEADEERGLLLGASDYIQKPFRPAIVRARVKVHLKLAMQRRALERQSLQDGLTGIANRRYFDDALQRALRETTRSGCPLGVAILDVDHFKQYNDCYGHNAGDEALRYVARTLDTSLQRAGDLAARYGGEEFVILIKQAENFKLLLEEMRQQIAAAGIPHEGSPTADVLTISGGGVVVGSTIGLSSELLIERADRLLYEAKQGGRNRILIELDV